MVSRQVAAIHLVCDQHFRRKRFRPQKASGIRDWFRWNRLFFRCAAVSPFEYDLGGIVGQPGLLEQATQRNSCPFGISYGS